MRCPRCEDPLLPFFLEERGVALDGRQCPTCRGVFFEAAQLEAATAIVKVGAFELRRVPGEDVQRAPLCCPACEIDVEMKKARSARDAHVTIDACPRCGGAWLDAGELAAIQRDSLWALLVGGGRRGSS